MLSTRAWLHEKFTQPDLAENEDNLSVPQDTRRNLMFQ